MTSPEKIVCVGLNYRKHAAETDSAVPSQPILFNKYNSALNGHRGGHQAGEVRQSSNTADMVFGCASLIGYISRYFTLRPGDIIFTGTPEGVISGYPKDRQVWLKAGDQITSTLEGLGELRFSLA